jgi:tight adherence protein C
MDFNLSIGDQVTLISIAFFIALFLFCIGVHQAVRQRGVRSQLIGRIRGGGIELEIDTPQEIERFSPKGPSAASKFFRKIGKHASPAQAADYSAARLPFLRAGIRGDNTIAVFWGVKIFLVIALPLAFMALRSSILHTLNFQVTLALLVFCALLGFYLPDVYINRRSESRRAKILQALPDALDLMVICVEAGMGLDSAINKVAEEMRISCIELSDELQLMNFELRAGKQRTDALKNLALRTNLDEISSLTTLLVQTDKFGTSMADALRVYSDSYRTQRYQKAEEMAAKLPVKMVIPLIFFIFPSLFLVILGPAAINIYRVLIKGAMAH